MNVTRTTDKKPTDARGRRWMTIDEWFALQERTADPGLKYWHRKDPANVIAKVAA